MINRNMPEFGVVDDLLKDEMDGVDRFKLWLLLHTSHLGHLVVRKMAIDKCVPKFEDIVFKSEKWHIGLSPR